MTLNNMLSTFEQVQKVNAGRVRPLCPVFGECQGCLYQDMAYVDELRLKEEQLKELLGQTLRLSSRVYRPIVTSPKPYHYRNRLDLKLKRTKDGVLIGFTPVQKRGVLPVEACYIAQKNISGFIPELKRQAIEQLPAKYREANLVVRTGDDNRVLWGGIGRRSCHLQAKDYLWTRIAGKKIFYSLDTFFQANLSILPELLKTLRSFAIWKPRPTLYDLYGGVGLFGIILSDRAQRIVLAEENPASLALARHNIAFNGIKNMEVLAGKVEECLPALMAGKTCGMDVALLDPPRAGLSARACDLVAGWTQLSHLIYLSCHPEALARDLAQLTEGGWAVERVIPFDFFPKTKHLETLVLLKRA